MSPPSVFIPLHTSGGRGSERERDDSITHNPLPLPGDALHTEWWRGEDEEGVGSVRYRERGVWFRRVFVCWRA